MESCNSKTFVFFSLDRLVTKSQMYHVSTNVSCCCCLNLKREVDILASSLIDLKQKQPSDDIWFLVTGKSNEKTIEYEIGDFH